MTDEPESLNRVFAILLALLPGGLWCVWWLWAVNWKKLAPVLRQGAWAPVLLLMLVAAAAWSRIAPSECTCLGFVAIPNFLWQLGSVTALALVALFCGWLQGVYGWAPLEVAVEPAAHTHDDDHGHGQSDHAHPHAQVDHAHVIAHGQAGHH